jgi:hypothetical protein
MRNSIAALLVIILCSTASQGVAQFNLGIKAGGNFSVFGPAYGYTYKERLGYMTGLTSHIRLGSSSFFLNPEILYTRKAFRLLTPVFLDERMQYSDVIMGLSYLEIPLHVGYGSTNLIEGEQDVFMMFYAGVQPGFLQGQHLRFQSFGPAYPQPPDITEFEHINPLNIAINLGLGVGYRRFFFDLRFSIGVMPLYTVEKDDDNVSTTQISVGYKLF